MGQDCCGHAIISCGESNITEQFHPFPEMVSFFGTVSTILVRVAAFKSLFESRLQTKLFSLEILHPQRLWTISTILYTSVYESRDFWEWSFLWRSVRLGFVNDFNNLVRVFVRVLSFLWRYSIYICLSLGDLCILQ